MSEFSCFSSIKVMVSYRWLVVFICESLLQSFISNLLLPISYLTTLFWDTFYIFIHNRQQIECIVLQICPFLSTDYVFFKEVHDLTLF